MTSSKDFRRIIIVLEFDKFSVLTLETASGSITSIITGDDWIASVLEERIAPTMFRSLLISNGIKGLGERGTPKSEF